MSGRTKSSAQACDGSFLLSRGDPTCPGHHTLVEDPIDDTPLRCFLQLVDGAQYRRRIT